MHLGVLGAVGTGLLLLAAGCGQTDYATQVTSTGAHLNATITTLNEQAPTTGWFEYWPTSAPSSAQETTHRDVTDTGPFGEAVGGLQNHTEYRYRFCGSEGGSDRVCAQTHRFTTGRETVQAYGESEREVGPTRSRWFSDLDFDLVAGPSGVSGPGVVTEHFVGTAGHLQFDIGGPAGSYEVTCFEVSGNTATIGFHRTEDQISLQSFAQLVDGGPLGSGLDTVAGHINELPGVEQRNPSDCSSPVAGALPLKAGEIVINEAPPGPG
jgi:hypothetical protein